jgi:pyruvate dehydrogenase E2 component (dihydrolipoamide acetyltransferase)
MIKEVRIPEISENVTSGKVVAVLVHPGDEIEVDDPIIEFETEKAVVEIPSPFKGRVTEVLAGEGDELNVGDVIARIDTETEAGRKEARAEGKRGGEREAGGAGKAETAARDEALEEGEEAIREERKPAEEPGRKTAEATGYRKRKAEAEPGQKEEKGFPEDKEKRPRGEGDAQKRLPAPASPSVRRFARELGVDIHEVQPGEPGSRITEADVKAFVKRARLKGERPAAAASAGGPGEAPGLPDFTRWGEIESRELTGVRRLTAEKMAASWQAVVHVTQFDRVDITAVREFMRRKAEQVAEQGGRLTITAVLMKACAAALRRFPQFNTSIDLPNHRLIFKKYVHVGLAVDTPRGLLVPVVRHADRKTILELAVEIVDLAGRARDKKIKPDEMEGGTFTISNQGGIGGTDFTPVVFWPQAAILGVSQASTEPRYIDSELRPREILPLALSYDHRIADGADAARFLRWIRESIEHPLAMHFD